MYLIYIGYKSLKTGPKEISKTEDVVSEQKTLAPLCSVRIGFLTNVLNPKVTLFMLALFTQVIDPTTPKIILSLYGLEMVTVTFLWFSLVSVFFSNSLIKARINKVQHYVEKFTGVVLIALGIKVALSSNK